MRAESHFRRVLSERFPEINAKPDKKTEGGDGVVTVDHPAAEERAVERRQALHVPGYRRAMGYDPTARTLGELLEDWAAIMRELKVRDVLRTNNLPTGDFAEVIVAVHFGGTRGGSSQTGWDVIASDGERLQVKGTRHLGTGVCGASITPIRDTAYDSVVVVVFDEDFVVIEGLKFPREVVEERFPVEQYRNARAVRLTRKLRADSRVESVDLSEAHRRVHDGIVD